MDVHPSVIIQDPSTKLRYNLHNIAATIMMIQSLVMGRIFTPAEITIITPYRAQNFYYRLAFAKASKAKFWQDHDIWAIRLMTIDSIQDGQNACVFLYV